MNQDVSNQVLAALSPDDFALLRPHLEPVDLTVGHVIEPAHKPITSNYFLERGLASVIATGQNRCRIEVGMVGPEGMTGLPVVMGNDRSANETIMQVWGTGSRIAAGKLREGMLASRSMHNVLLNAVHTFMMQMAHTTAVSGTARLDERLARWLLMAKDRVGNSVDVTHEVLAQVLGVRRAGVTVALNRLEREGFILLARGWIHIVDRPGLTKSANGTYGIPKAPANQCPANDTRMPPNALAPQERPRHQDDINTRKPPSVPKVPVRPQDDWERKYRSLVHFKAIFHHCDVKDWWAPELYEWANLQRALNNRGDPERKARLVDLGFRWSCRAKDWRLCP